VTSSRINDAANIKAPAFSRSAIWGVAAALCAFVLLYLNLDALGLWSKADFPILNRSRGALGESLEGLAAHPWLPDRLRTWGLETVGGDLGIRIPGALAAAALVGAATGWTHRSGCGPLQSILAGGFALSFPVLQVSGSTLQGNPIGELAVATAILAGIGAFNRRCSRNWPARVALCGLAFAGLAAAVLSLGIFLGAALPLTILALCRGVTVDIGKIPSMIAWLAAAVCGATALHLMLGQTEGYIPLLGAAKDLDLIDRPQRRLFTVGFREAGHALFPWTAVAIVGLLRPSRDRGSAIWLTLSILASAGWSLVYGFTAPAVTVPAAVLCASAIQQTLDTGRPALVRRLSVAIMVIGIAVLAKDADTAPSKVASPMHNLKGEQHYPADLTDASGRFRRMGSLAILGILAAFTLAPPSEPARRRPFPGSPPWLETFLQRLRIREQVVSPRLRTQAAAMTMVAALTIQALAYNSVFRDSARQMSARGPLERWSKWAASETLPPLLGVHRLRDPGVERYSELYTNDALIDIKARADLVGWLAEPEPRVAMLRHTDYAYVFQKLRGRDVSLHTLDWDHHKFVLVANHLPPGLVDHNPLKDIVLDAPPALEHETFVRFGKYVELIAWQIDPPLARGKTTTFHLAFRVLRKLPNGAKVIARLQKGKMSRINAAPHELAQGLYPPSYWRKGDFIHHRVEVDISWLQALPGRHKLIVALKKSSKTQMDITDPPADQKKGKFGVKIRGKKHQYATIGVVEVR